MDHKTSTITALNELGRFLSQFSTESTKKNDSVRFNDLFFDGFLHQIKVSKEHNGWFSTSNMMFAIESWAKLLQTEPLTNWVSNYTFESASPKKVAIIMAGNIPLGRIS